MIDNIFILSPRGDTIIAKTYFSKKSIDAHERSHTDAFFRRIKFWDDMNQVKTASGDDLDDDALAAATAKLDLATTESKVEDGGGSEISTSTNNPRAKADAPPVFIMPDGLSYFHVKRNGLIFGCSCVRNVSPTTIIEVSTN
jgi:AP-4 complex subunit mu-1